MFFLFHDAKLRKNPYFRSMKERLFRFKHFQVSHSQSSMPIGVDAVLIGAWANAEGKRILDVGTGCGVIALMLAERNRNAEIVGIDIHSPSIEEATQNFHCSPWNERILARHATFKEIVEEGGEWDCIVSNPPYFDAGVKVTDDARVRARHVGELSPMNLVADSCKILGKDGRLSMIFPYEMADCIEECVEKNGMYISRRCDVADHRGAKIKRTMMEIRCKGETGSFRNVGKDDSEKLIMFDEHNDPTPEYRDLCKDFYLKF